MKYLAVKVAGCISFFLTKKILFVFVPKYGKSEQTVCFRIIESRKLLLFANFTHQKRSKNKTKKKRFFLRIFIYKSRARKRKFSKIKNNQKKKKLKIEIRYTPERERKYFDLDDQPMVEIDFLFFFWRFPKNHSNSIIHCEY